MPEIKNLENRIFNCDCIEFMANIPDGSIDIIICDPPFGMTASKWDSIIPFDLLWAQYKRIVKKNANIILFGAEPFSSLLRTSNLKDYKYDLYLRKNNSSNPFLAKYRPLRTIENVCVFTNGGGVGTYNPQMVKGKPYKWSSKRSGGESANIKFEVDTPIVNEGWRFPLDVLEGFKTERGLHPTQKSTEMLSWLLKSYSNEEEIVLDSCMGSGSTCISAIDTNRRFIGIEKDTHSFEVSQKRINERMLVNGT